MNERETLLKKIAACDFAIVELHLFLDTHPDNNAAASKLNKYVSKSDELKKEFESKYGPLSSMSEDINKWAWISNPWPWDLINDEEENSSVGV